MKRSIPKSLVQRALETSTSKDEPDMPADLEMKSAGSPYRGAGSAWKAGALAQSQSAVQAGREALCNDILNGRHEIMLDPAQVTDPLGTDRRADWLDQPAFEGLVQSIEANGQDTPVLVWPVDLDWQPDPLDPTNVDGVPFMLLTGRRRHAAAVRLGLHLRATLASPERRDTPDAQFEMLFLRFRENEARENLSAFERLQSIGEMYEELKRAEGKLTAVAFAKRIGVHESVISRARAVYGRKDEILNAFKNAYDMSFGDLQKALAALDMKAAKPRKASDGKLTAKRKIGTRNLSLSHANGTLSIKAAGVPVDQAQLEELSDLIADFLNTKAGRPARSEPRVTQL